MIYYRHGSRHCAPPYTRSLMHPVVLLAEENTLQITTTLRYTLNLPMDNIWSPKTFLVLILGTYKLCIPWKIELPISSQKQIFISATNSNSTTAHQQHWETISASPYISALPTETTTPETPTPHGFFSTSPGPRLASRGRSNSGDSMPGISAKGHACSKTWLM